MKAYAIRNQNGEYLSMSMTLTKNWFEASKFPKEDIEKRKRFLDERFEIVEFEVKELINNDKNINDIHQKKNIDKSKRPKGHILNEGISLQTDEPYFKGYKNKNYFQ